MFLQGLKLGDGGEGFEDLGEPPSPSSHPLIN